MLVLRVKHLNLAIEPEDHLLVWGQSYVYPPPRRGRVPLESPHSNLAAMKELKELGGTDTELSEPLFVTIESPLIMGHSRGVTLRLCHSSSVAENFCRSPMKPSKLVDQNSSKDKYAVAGRRHSGTEQTRPRLWQTSSQRFRSAGATTRDGRQRQSRNMPEATAESEPSAPDADVFSRVIVHRTTPRMHPHPECQPTIHVSRYISYESHCNVGTTVRARLTCSRIQSVGKTLVFQARPEQSNKKPRTS